MKLKSPAKIFLSVSWYISLSCLLAACGSTNKIRAEYVYFQDGPNVMNSQQKEIIIHPNDLLGVQVYSKTTNQEQAAIFNIPLGVTPAGYQVSEAGNIEMPVLGAVKAAGLTKEQLQDQLVQKLTTYVKNPSVLVRFLQFSINVMGEVKAPGTKTFIVDKVTIIDALSAAGDLTDFGKRGDIMVIREEGGKKIFHSVDLRDKSVFQSPVYIMQPNDIIYVGPTNNRLGILGSDPEKQRKTSFLISLTSVFFGVVALVLTIVR